MSITIPNLSGAAPARAHTRQTGPMRPAPSTPLRRPIGWLATLVAAGAVAIFAAGCSTGQPDSSPSWVPQQDFQANAEPQPQLPGGGLALPQPTTPGSGGAAPTAPSSGASGGP